MNERAWICRAARDPAEQPGIQQSGGPGRQGRGLFSQDWEHIDHTALTALTPRTPHLAFGRCMAA